MCVKEHRHRPNTLLCQSCDLGLDLNKIWLELMQWFQQVQIEKLVNIPISKVTLSGHRQRTSRRVASLLTTVALKSLV